MWAEPWVSTPGLYTPTRTSTTLLHMVAGMTGTTPTTTTSTITGQAPTQPIILLLPIPSPPSFLMIPIDYC